MTTPFDCPRCGTTLTMSERSGIEIDYCGQCRGVWLDRGELDKIIARAADQSPEPPRPAAGSPPSGGWTQPVPPPVAPTWATQQPPRRRGDDDWDDDRRRGQHGKSRKGWLSDLFD